MKCVRCDERLIVVIEEAMGKTLECKCGVRVEVPYGDVLKGVQLDRMEKEK